MIEFPNQIFQPNFEVSCERRVVIQSISEQPENEDHFKEWLAAKSTELSNGKHREYFVKDEGEIEVNFTIIITNIQMSVDHNETN